MFEKIPNTRSTGPISFSISGIEGTSIPAFKGGYIVHPEYSDIMESIIELNPVKMITRKIVEIIKIKFAIKFLKFLLRVRKRYTPKKVKIKIMIVR